MKFLKWFATTLLVLAFTLSVPATAMAAPSKPGSPTPANGSSVSTFATQIVFKWSSTAGVGGTYDFNVCLDALCSSTVDNQTGLSTNTWTSTYAFTAATNYWWEVQAYDISSVASGWQIFGPFHTSVDAPVLNTLTSPLDNNLTNDIVDDTANNPLQPPFSWSSVLNATGYVLQISPSNSFSSFILNVTLSGGSNTSYTPTKDLPANTQFYWRVQALSGTWGPGIFSTDGPILSANPPAIPLYQQPCNGCTDYDFTPGLGWQFSTVPGGTTFGKYDVQVSLDKNFKTPAKLCFDDTSVTTPGTLTTPPGLDVENALLIDPIGASCPTFTYTGGGGSVLSLQPATTFYWRVRSTDTDNITSHESWSDWSTVFTLYTAFEKVDSTLFNPADGSTLTSNVAPFTWTAPTGDGGATPSGYNIQVSTDPAFQRGIVINANVGTNSFTPNKLKPLPACTDVYWRVRALGGNYGPGPFSAGAHITTACPPTVPRLLTPKKGTRPNTDLPTLTWVASAVPFLYGPVTYEVQVSASDPTFTWGMFEDDTGLSTNSDTMSTNLIHGYRYYWRVQACDTQPACSAWSNVYVFNY